MARQGLGLAGGIIGAYFGGPVGAQIGFAIGGALGGAIDPETVQGPKLGEAPIQTGRDGVVIPVGWGLCHTMGNIIQKNPIVEVEEEEDIGKGGGKSVTTTVRYRSFAIGVARSYEGPIAEILRIWENDKLVYDKRETPTLPVAETAEFEKGIRIYLGDEAQLPDPDLEAEWGVGNTPAYRGLAYVMFVDKKISDFGSAIPQYRFEFQTWADLTETSKPYPIEFGDAMVGGVVPGDGLQSIFHIDAAEGGVLPAQGSLASALKLYDDWPPEAIEGGVLPESGTIAVKLKKYADWPPEAIEGGVIPERGDLASRLILYSNWPPEALEGGVLPKDGTLT